MKFLSKIIFVILLFASVTIYVACNKNNLNVPPPTATEASSFEKEGDFQSAIFGIYALLTDYYSSSNIAGGSGSAELQTFFLPGDDLTNNGEEAFEVFGNAINPADGKISQIFSSSYIMMNRANKVLTKINTVADGVYTTPNLKNYHKGEVLFLRGFAHYMLWNGFGTAPLDTIDITTIAQLNPSNSQGTELLDQAISDFTQAAGLLPATWDDVNKGRVTANSANGMLGKALVFRASINHSNEDYQAAIAALNKITGASLTANFLDNFDVDKENNSESIFEYQAGANINGFTNTWLGNDNCDCGVASGYWQCFYNGPATYMGGGLYTATNKLKNSFDAADPRLPLTLNTTDNNITKYVLKDRAQGPGNSDNNARILRYSDVLLLKAEAILQSGGSITEAVSLVNQVRTRARNMVAGGLVPADFSVAETDKNIVMQWIMDERLRELAAEGQRWFDLRRWALGGFITLDNDFFSSIVPTRMKWDDHNLNFPIPYSETDKNPNIKQNPGY
ncbi:MAG: RagB/SusD family nutrient uptake outer membrane protein [Panacibacter sp.]